MLDWPPFQGVRFKSSDTYLGLLRILLAICVFCAHSRSLAHLRWLGGDLAVELFFVISGFYMQLILSTRYTRSTLGKSWVISFYKARYLRLLPIYLLGSVLVIGTALLQPGTAPLSIWREVWALPKTAGNSLFQNFLCFTDATMLFQDMTMFFAVHDGVIHWSGNFWDSTISLANALTIPPAWSLGIELSFYLIAPYVLGLRSRWLLIGAGCGLAAKMTALEALRLGDPWTFRFFPFELGYFFLGALAFRYRQALHRFVPANSERYFVYPFVICLVAVRLPVPIPTLVYPVILACALPFLFRMTSGLKADRLLGELSYPFYILHVFCLYLAAELTRRWFLTEDLMAWIGLSLTLVLSAVVLTLEMRLIEPWRARFAEPPVPVRSDLVTHR
jgi:peptidoglycan/LPS O-acetylase OafA/YrhL